MPSIALLGRECNPYSHAAPRHPLSKLLWPWHCTALFAEVSLHIHACRGPFVYRSLPQDGGKP